MHLASDRFFGRKAQQVRTVFLPSSVCDFHGEQLEEDSSDSSAPVEHWLYRPKVLLSSPVRRFHLIFIMSPATKWSLICVSEAESGGSYGEVDFCHVWVGVIECSGAPVLICHMVKIASGNTCFIFNNHTIKNRIHLSSFESLSATNVFIAVLFSASLVLKNLIDGKKSSLCGPVNKLKSESCFWPGLCVLEWEAVEACNITVQLSSITFALFAKELATIRTPGAFFIE